MTTNNNPTVPVSLDALAVGRSSTNPFLTVFETRNPNSGDINYQLQQRWYNTVAESEWILTGFSVIGNIKTAIWQPIAASVVTIVETLTGNTGGAVGPDGSNNINVIGDGTSITIAGNPATHTLTASTTGAIATLYTENTGTATPAAGNLNVLGTNGLTTTGSGSTVTISSANGQIMTGTIPDAHTAPGTSPVVPNSSGNITVTGGQVAAGTTANVIRTNSLAANTYTVQVQRSQAVSSSTIADNGVSHYSSNNFSVDGNGFVTLAAMPSFLATYSSSVTNVTGDGTSYHAIYDTTVFDNLGNYNNGTGVFTAPIAGVYIFTCVLNWGNITNAFTSFIIDIVKNGTLSIHGGSGGPFGQADSSGSLSSHGSVIIKLSVNDTIYVTTAISGGTKTVGIIAASYPTFYQNTFSGSYLHP